MSEHLPKPEYILPAKSSPETERLEPEYAIEEFYAERLAVIEEIKPYIGLKFCYEITSKVESEKATHEALLDIHKNTREHLSQYSLVLDPQYFEQEFLN